MDISKTVQTLLQEAKNLQLLSKYEDSMLIFEKVNLLLDKTQQVELWFYCQGQTVVNIAQLGKYVEGQTLITSLLNNALDSLGDNHLETARLYHTLSAIEHSLGNFQEALTYGHQALAIRLAQLPEIHIDVFTSYNALARTYLYTQYHKKAYEYLQKLLSIESKIDDPYPKARLYVTLGNYFYGIDNLKAQTNYTKALQIAQKELPPSNSIFSLIYLNLGASHELMGNHSKALDYSLQALQLKLNNQVEKSAIIAILFMNISRLWMHKQDHTKAAEYYVKAKDIYETIYLTENTHLAKFYNFTGFYYKKTDPQKALKAFAYSMNIWEREAKKGNGWSQNINSTLNNIGDLYLETKDYPQAKNAYQKALNLTREIIQQEHGIPLKLISTYNKLSHLFLIQQQYTVALEHNKKAIELNQQIIENNNIVFEPLSLLASFNTKIKLLLQYFHQNKTLSLLEESYKISKECEQIINKHRNFYQDYEDRIAFNNTIHQTFEHAIEVCYLLHQNTQQIKYLCKAFDYFEKSKAYTLLQSIQEMQALRYTDVPNEILEQERDLKTQITYNEKQLNQAYAKKENTKIKKYQKILFEKRKEYRQLINKLENKFPAYYKLKYNPTKVKVEEVQAYLDNQTALLEYFEGDHTIYYLAIQKDDIQLFQHPKTETWQTTYANFHQSLTQKEKVFDSEKIEETYDTFVENAHALFQILLAPYVNTLAPNITKLQIIPDGKLSYIPFEILLQNPATNRRPNYRNLDYLLTKYAVGYVYSATLLLEQQIGKKTDTTENYGGFAPIYHNETMQAYKGLIAEYKENKVYSIALREGLEDLPDARKSVSHIAQLMKGKAFLAKEATKEKFVQLVSNFKILHLAMHGLVDHENPLYSKLVFTPEDNTQNHLLEAGDLYNMEINAHLTVLSACNTGYGKMRKGEGVMSLSRAFTYAGCPSVIMSLWSVPDLPTSEIMIRFFEILKAGFTKDEALQKAKLAYLEESPFSESHPLFWAGFVPTGDMAAIDL